MSLEGVNLLPDEPPLHDLPESSKLEKPEEVRLLPDEPPLDALAESNNLEKPSASSDLVAEIDESPEDDLPATIPAEQIIDDELPPTIPAEQIIADELPATIPAEQIIDDDLPATIPAEQIRKVITESAAAPEAEVHSNVIPAAAVAAATATHVVAVPQAVAITQTVSAAPVVQNEASAEHSYVESLLQSSLSSTGVQNGTLLVVTEGSTFPTVTAASPNNVFTPVTDLNSSDAFQVTAAPIVHVTQPSIVAAPAVIPEHRPAGRRPAGSANGSVGGDEIKTCEFCQRSGPANTFYSATKRFCSVGCCHRFSASHQRPRRVAMRSMRESNSATRPRKESRRERERDRGSELYRSSTSSQATSSTTETFDPPYDMYGLPDWTTESLNNTSAELDDIGSPLLQPYHVTSAPTAAGTKKFDWVSYLQETNSVAAPEYCFLERHLPQRNMFDVDMKVELACDITQSPSNAYLMTVTQVMGMRAKLSYDGCPDAPCEVRSIDSTDIFPLGWCSAQGGQIVAHPDCPTSISQNWAEFLEKTLAKAVGVPDGYFPMKPSRSVPEYLPGHKLEISLAEDGQTRYCVATVAEVLSTSVIIHLDGYEDDSTHYHSLPRDTTQLHPVGYCNERDLKLCPPKGVTDEVFDWDSYLQFTGAVAAPRDLFRTTNNLFLPGMKLEAVDNRNPHMICVATVAEVQDDTIKVHFDGWSEKFDLVVKKDDENVFPVGWCAKYGHAVQPPLERGALGKHVRSLSADATPLTPTSYNLGGKRRKRSEAGAGASAGEPLSKRRLSTPAAPKGATPRAVFNIECDHGPFLDPRKVKALPHEVSGSSVAVVLQRTLQHLINASLDRRSVFDLVRPGHSTAIVQCVLPNGERLLKHLQIVDRNNILWGIIKGMLNKLQCCERFITARNVQGQCVRCTTADEIGLSATSSGGHPGQAGAYDAASVSGTPVEQHYSLDGPWLSANGSAHSVSKREADGISPLPQTYNPNRPVVTSSAGGSVLLNSHSSMGSDAGLFNNPKIEHLANKNPKTWTVDDVKSYFENSECSSHVSTLVDQEIDGNAMLLLTPDTLVRFMGLRLGPSLKICGRVDGLKTKWGIH